jgi:ubiquinone biosynthesis accessory factor UbiJ
MPSRLLASALETAINGALQLDAITRERLTGLAGRTIAVELRGPDQTVYLHPGAAGLRVRADCDQPPDLTLRATPLTLFELARGADFDRKDLELVGDVDLARDLQALLAGLDIDWEEPLARLFGDLPAHRLGSLIRSGRDWSHQALTSLIHNTGEYLQYERRDLPPAHQVADFVDAVDRLRDDLERLEARVRRLHHRLTAPRPNRSDP